MKLSSNGLELIKSFEGLSLKACKCVPTEKYYTIGYGHYGADVKPDATISKEDALKLLQKDVDKFVDKVNKYDKIYKFNQNEFDALVSFAYNVGSIDKLTANGTRTREKIAECMLFYNKSGGKVLNGLKSRRKKERELFLKKIPTTANIKKELYYPKYTGSVKKLDSILRAVGVPEKYLGSWKSRKKLAEINGIINYTGNVNQNTILKNLAKNGILKRV